MPWRIRPLSAKRPRGTPYFSGPQQPVGCDLSRPAGSQGGGSVGRAGFVRRRSPSDRLCDPMTSSHRTRRAPSSRTRRASRCPLAALVIAALTAVLLPGCGDEAREAKVDAPAPSDGFRPAKHVVLISIDTLRADRLSCYGYERPTSPEIDAFAADSLLFEQCTAPATNTTPSHMSMFTGLVPPVHRQFNVEPGPDGDIQLPVLLPPTMPMLAERFAAAGFATAAFTDGGYLTAELKFDRGFQHFDRRPETVDLKIDRVLEWVEQADWEQRQFLFVHTYEVHAPYVPPVEHDVFSDPAYDGPYRARLDELRAVVGRGGVAGARGFLPRGREARPEDTAYLSDLYDAGVRFTDAEVGRLLRALRSAPFADDVAILVLSDHGDAFNEHGAFGHNELFHTVTHVPFILHLPGGPTGRVSTPISGVDVTPTLLHVAGLPAPDATDGVSVLRSLDPMRAIFSYRENPAVGGGLSFRKGPFKLLRNAAHQPWQHFDLSTDFDETTPLATDTPEVARALDVIEELGRRHTRAGEILHAGSSGTAGEMSDEMRASLEALGYVGDDDDPPAPPPSGASRDG